MYDKFIELSAWVVVISFILINCYYNLNQTKEDRKNEAYNSVEELAVNH